MSRTAHHIGPDSAPDRYRLLRSIGRGGEAVLYLAEIDLAGGAEPVVVKVLDSKTTITPEIFERVSRKWNEQAELLRFVSRPGVVGVREHFQGAPIHRPGESDTLTGRALVLVMNHVDGLDLRDWRAERTLATPAERREVMRTLEQLADVLDWLHSGKATPSGRIVVHGDLSPGNVMVDEHGQATLVDFGLSKLTADHQTAEVWFTPGYAAPEIFEGKRTPATDRYAFGAIAYFLLSGQSPPTAPEQLAAALGAVPQIAGLPEEQRRRVLAITAADADRRPLSLSAWVKEVRHGVVSTTTTSRPAGPRDAVPPLPSDAPAAVPPLPADAPAGPRDAVPPPPAGAPAVPPPPVVPPGAGPQDAPPQDAVPAPPTQPPAATAAPTPPPAPAPEPVAASAPEPAAPAPAGFGAPLAPAGGYDAAQGPYGPPAAGVPAYGTPGHGTPAYGNPPYGDRTYGAPGHGHPTAGTAAADATAAPRRSRKGLVIGSVAGVLLIAVLAVAGVQLLAKKDAGETGAKGAGSGAPTTTAPTTAEQPSADPSTEQPTEEPASEEPADPATSGSPSVAPGAVPDATEADLTTLASVSDPDDFEIGSSKINTKEYGSALIGDCYGGAYVEYDLNREWKTFQFTAGVDDGSRIETARIIVSIDDKPALFNETVRLGKPIAASLKVEGALRLRLKVEATCTDSGNGVIAAPMLLR
ncbi:protein kinase domain-containing protein [Streptomyces termitum]|uniref:protein kinase domain-containing protein n=1 Tax=Streptomyces termitum TaxID=67368 RepID=UPI00339F6048